MALSRRCPIDTLRQMYDFRCGLIAMHEPYAKLLSREAIDRDEAMAVEELVQFDFKCEERQFAEQWGSDLRLTEPAHLQRYGMLVGYDGLNPRDPYCGLSMSLIDPTTVYPVWAGAGGLIELYRVYQDTADNIAGNYGGKPGSPDFARLQKKLKNSNGNANSDLTANHRTELRKVTEVWNRDHMAVQIDDDDEFLVTRKHGYHEVPFTVVIGNFDLPAATSSGYDREAETLNTPWGDIVLNDASVDTARRYRPFDWKRLKTHRVSEAVAGRALTTYKDARDPHKVYEWDPVMNKNQKPELGPLHAGKTTYVAIPGKLHIVTPVVDPTAMAVLNMALGANAQSGILGQLAAGTVPPQTSGSALNAMIEIGGAADIAIVRLIQLFKRLRAEKRLRLRMGFGGMLGRDGDRGATTVPSSRGYSSTPYHRVTPDMIERTNIELDIELFNWRPDVTVAQYLSTLRTPGRPACRSSPTRRRGASSRLSPTPTARPSVSRTSNSLPTRPSPSRRRFAASSASATWPSPRATTSPPTTPRRASSNWSSCSSSRSWPAPPPRPTASWLPRSRCRRCNRLRVEAPVSKSPAPPSPSPVSRSGARAVVPRAASNRPATRRL